MVPDMLGDPVRGAERTIILHDIDFGRVRFAGADKPEGRPHARAIRQFGFHFKIAETLVEAPRAIWLGHPGTEQAGMPVALTILVGGDREALRRRFERSMRAGIVEAIIAEI